MAKAEATIAICTGVTRVSYWPIEVVANWAPSRSVPIVEGVTASGISSRAPKPNFSAVPRSWSSPSSWPSRAKEVLQDCRSASERVEESSGPQGVWSPPAWLFICEEELGSWYTPGPGITVSGVYCPESRAEAATTSLKAEPGGYRSPPVARLVIGRDGSSFSSFQAACTSEELWLARRLGS